MESPFKRLDDEKFAVLMDRWLANGGAAELAAAISRNGHTTITVNAPSGLSADNVEKALRAVGHRTGNLA